LFWRPQFSGALKNELLEERDAKEQFASGPTAPPELLGTPVSSIFRLKTTSGN
jgi:hypothetical protein